MAQFRRFLIAAGTAKYDKLPEDQQLPSVYQDLARIVDCFTACGYEQALVNVCKDPSAEELKEALGQWLEDRSASDQVIFYYSGHGEFVERDGYYLACRDAKYDAEGQLSSSKAFSAEEIAKAISQSQLQDALIILDICFCTAGLFGFSKKAADLFYGRQWKTDLPHGIHLIAASREWQKANEGVFSVAFCNALANRDGELGGALQPFLRPEAVVGAVNAMLNDSQQAQYLCVTPRSDDRVELLPNPRFKPDRPEGLGLADHWIPKAQGGSLDSRASYFTGRERALHELIAWLSEPKGDGKARVVIGSADCGKSALLARLVLLSDAEQHVEDGALANVRADTIPPVGCIDLRIHAHGKTRADVATEIGKPLNIPDGRPIDDIVATLKARTERFTVVVDALDEAKDPETIAFLLRKIAPLAAVRLLVATRPDTAQSQGGQRFEGLGNNTVELDLDSPKFLGRSDLEDYLTRRLLAVEEPNRHTPYRGRRDLVEPLAKAVAARCGRLFFVAQLVADALIEAEQPLTTKQAESLDFPATVGAAFENYLDRFDEVHDLSKATAVDLLRPLAYGEGAGIPFGNIWPSMATALADSEYVAKDIVKLNQYAGSFVIESLEDGQSVYRLYHAALADHLRAERNVAHDQERIVQALIALVPARQGDRKHWLNANPYIKTHLASHAAAGRVLDALVTDPGYLAAADPIRLVPALATLADGRAREIANVYRRIAHELPMAEPLERMALIHLVACEEALALALDLELSLATAWRCRWARWMPSAPNRILGRHAGSVLTVALAEVDGEPVVVSGSADNTVRLWDPRTGQPRGEPLTGHTKPVNAVALGEVDGEPVVVSGSFDRTVRLWDARTGRPRGKPLTGHTSLVNAVTLGEVDGEPVVVSGSADKTVRLWDVRTCRPRGEPLTGHTKPVNAVALGEVDGELLVVSGSADNTVRLWDVRTGRPRGEPLTGHTKPVNAVALGEVDGEPLVVSGSADETVRLWDACTGRPCGEPLTGHTSDVNAVALDEVDGEPVVVSGSSDKTVRLWDARTGQPRGEPLTGHTGWVNAVALGEVDVEPVVVSGSGGYTGDCTVRLWDARTGCPRGEPLTGHTGPVNAVALGEVDGEPVVVSGSVEATGGKVRLWDPRSHSVLRIVPLRSMVTGLAMGKDSAVAVGAHRGLMVLDFSATREV
jgi:WD40 repeat protein